MKIDVDLRKISYNLVKFILINMLFHIFYSDFTSTLDAAYGNCYTFNGDLKNLKMSYREGQKYGIKFIKINNKQNHDAMH